MHFLACILLVLFSTIVKAKPLSPETKAELMQAMGVTDLEAHRQHISDVGDHLVPPPDYRKIALNSIRLASVKEQTKVEARNGTLGGEIEINNEAGIAPYLFQSDIALTEAQLNALDVPVSEVPGRRRRQATSVQNLWTNNILYYSLDEGLSSKKVSVVLAAFDYIQRKTCISFQKRNYGTRIRVFSGSGCYSYVGMSGGEQNLSLADGCERMGTVVHEFMHALGIWHTQMRYDRDDYVTVDLGAVEDDLVSNFAKLSTNEMYPPTVPYEYGSVMHYPSIAFAHSYSRPSIIPNDLDYLNTMGNRQLISFYDMQQLNDLYKCDQCAGKKNECLNGGVPSPRNCSICNCPAGYSGSLCDQRPEGCGASLVATDTWQTASITVGTYGNYKLRDFSSTCTSWITAPEGTQVQVKVTSMINSLCDFGCPYAGIEIKQKADKKVTNPISCCPSHLDTIYTSVLNPTPMIAFNQYHYSVFKFEYRYDTTFAPTTTMSTTKTTTKTTTTPILTTTTSVTSRPTDPCTDIRKDCAVRKSEGFCTDSSISIDTRKYNCAKTCGFCGKAKDPCNDILNYSRCLTKRLKGECKKSPMLMEYYCARSCGFCENPV